MISNKVYLLFGASGEWEDYREHILGMYDNRESAVAKMKQFRLKQEQDLSEWSTLVKEIVRYDREYDMDNLWDENCKNITFDEYLNDPEKYKNHLQLFIPPEAKLIREYVELNKRFEELGSFDGLSVNDVAYSVRIYSCSPTGDMTWEDTIYKCD